jgi:hypothetical protein
MTTFAPAVLAWSGTPDDDRRLVVLLHGQRIRRNQHHQSR